MSPETEMVADGFRRLLAAVLRYGTWIATGLIAAGLVLALSVHAGRDTGGAAVGFGGVNAGIALFILLPVIRVVLMLLSFLRQGDYRFGAAAALVLAIILFGFALNLVLPA